MECKEMLTAIDMTIEKKMKIIETIDDPSIRALAKYVLAELHEDLIAAAIVVDSGLLASDDEEDGCGGECSGCNSKCHDDKGTEDAEDGDNGRKATIRIIIPLTDEGDEE